MIYHLGHSPCMYHGNTLATGCRHCSGPNAGTLNGQLRWSCMSCAPYSWPCCPDMSLLQIVCGRPRAGLTWHLTHILPHSRECAAPSLDFTVNLFNQQSILDKVDKWSTVASRVRTLSVAPPPPAAPPPPKPNQAVLRLVITLVHRCGATAAA